MVISHSPAPRWLTVLGAAVLAVIGTSRAAMAQRPPAPKLLPDTTVALLSIPSAPEMAQKFMNTATGRMSQDPQLKPLIGRLYGAVNEALADAEKVIGLSLPQILAIPQGELTVAIIAGEEPRPVLVVMLDAGDQLSTARRLLGRGTAELDRIGAAKSEETVGDTRLTIYDGVGPGGRKVAYFERDATIVAGSDPAVLKQILKVWDGGKGSTLAENANFAAIMQRCRGAKDEHPQLFWYADPITLARSVGQGNTGAQVGLALLPALGVDGLTAVGGSVILDSEPFDSIMHAHVLLESPRSGIIKMIALEAGDVKPEPWVPADVASYTTVHWNVDKTYTTLATLYDSFRGKGAFASELERRILGPTKIDFEKDVIKMLEGRLTMLTSFERPARAQSQRILVGLKLKDPAPLEKSLEKLVQISQGNLVEQLWAGKKYYQVQAPRLQELPPDQRPPLPCFGLLDDYLLVANGPEVLQKVITAAGDEASPKLADELDFKLVLSKIRRHSGGSPPAMITFNRPEEGLRFVYDLATDPRNREQLAKAGEQNPFFRSVNSALDQHPLPPFAVLQQYFAPEGGMLIDDDSGIHYMAFSLRRE